jgi:hypothetical protein
MDGVDKWGIPRRGEREMGGGRDGGQNDGVDIARRSWGACGVGVCGESQFFFCP